MVRLFKGLTTPLLFIFVAFQATSLAGGDDEGRATATHQCAQGLARLRGTAAHTEAEEHTEPVSQPASQTPTQGNSTSASVVSLSSLTDLLPTIPEDGEAGGGDTLPIGSGTESGREDDGRGAVFKALLAFMPATLQRLSIDAGAPGPENRRSLAQQLSRLKHLQHLSLSLGDLALDGLASLAAALLAHSQEASAPQESASQSSTPPPLTPLFPRLQSFRLAAPQFRPQKPADLTDRTTNPAWMAQAERLKDSAGVPDEADPNYPLFLALGASLLTLFDNIPNLHHLDLKELLPTLNRSSLPYTPQLVVLLDRAQRNGALHALRSVRSYNHFMTRAADSYAALKSVLDRIGPQLETLDLTGSASAEGNTPAMPLGIVQHILYLMSERTLRNLCLPITYQSDLQKLLIADAAPHSLRSLTLTSQAVGSVNMSSADYQRMFSFCPQLRAMSMIRRAIKA